MGVALTGTSFVHSDNIMSVIYNTQESASVLNKKSNFVCFHAVQESIAMGELQTSQIASEDNLAKHLYESSTRRTTTRQDHQSNAQGFGTPCPPTQEVLHERL